MNSRSEASQPGDRGGHVTRFLFDIIGFLEILIFCWKTFGLCYWKREILNFMGKSLNLPNLLFRCHNASVPSLRQCCIYLKIPGKFLFRSFGLSVRIYCIVKLVYLAYSCTKAYRTVDTKHRVLSI